MDFVVLIVHALMKTQGDKLPGSWGALRPGLVGLLCATLLVAGFGALAVLRS